jgi:hypothetical protein
MIKSTSIPPGDPVTLTRLHGKKMTERLSEARFNSIDIPELIGVCKGVLADGTVNLAEAEFIQHWLDDRSDVLNTWPADELHRLLGRLLDDNALTDEEIAELTELLVEITGEPVSVIFY